MPTGPGVGGLRGQGRFSGPTGSGSLELSLSGQETLPRGPHRPEGTEQGADRWPIHLSTRHSSSHARGEVQNSGLGQPGDGHRNPSEAAQVRRRWGAPGQAQSPREQPGDPSTPLGASPPKETWGRRGHQVPPGGHQQGRPASPPSGTSTARAVGGTLARTCRGRTRDRLTGEWTPASPHTSPCTTSLWPRRSQNDTRRDPGCAPH